MCIAVGMGAVQHMGAGYVGSTHVHGWCECVPCIAVEQCETQASYVHMAAGVNGCCVL